MAKAPRRATKRAPASKQVDDYRHDEATRLNNPEAGLARYETEAPRKKTFEYDPRIDPQLVWAGKAEHTSFDVDAVTIHVHERLSTEAIVAGCARSRRSSRCSTTRNSSGTRRSASTSTRSTGPTV